MPSAAALLHAWGCWARGRSAGPKIPTRCGSIEHRYRPPAGEVFDEYRPRPPRISDDLACRIDRAVTACGRESARLLVMFYVRERCIATLGHELHLGDYDAARLALDAAIRQVGDRLQGTLERPRLHVRAAGATSTPERGLHAV